MCISSGTGFSPSDRALVQLGRNLKNGGYRFTTITPASHGRINARPAKGAPSLIDIFGWSRPFRATNISAAHLRCLAEADALMELADGSYSSRVRFSTLGDQLFVHSSFPTEESDAVFFGPDSYRFCRLIRQALATRKRRLRQPFRVLDIGAGSGAGGLHAAALASDTRPMVTLADINRRAVRFSRINAALNAVADVEVVESDLFGTVGGRFDLIVANPPYLVDPLTRLYRHGGGEFGSELSMRIIEQGLSRLNAGGRLVVYTGSAIIDGVDLFYETLSLRLRGRGVGLSYEEIDPDVFGEELEHPPYDRADRIAVVGAIISV
jgi:methylase of polypeptide subunit release factors